MKTTWSRRSALLALAGAGASGLLAACGSGSVVSDLNAKRFLTIGDGFLDVGQNGYLMTINDGTLNWVQQMASHYNLTISPSASGGTGYAQVHARVSADDTTSGTSAPSVTAQLTSLLADTSFVYGEDVLVISAGIADVVNAVQTYGATSADATTAVKTAGTELAAQVRRAVNAGARHVLVAGLYYLGYSPWGRGLNQVEAINSLCLAFNNALQVGIVNLGSSVLYADSALMYNLIVDEPANYAFDNVSDAVCTTTDASTCTDSTLLSGANPARYLWADSLYMTPTALRIFGNDGYSETAYYKFKDRW